VNSLRFVPTTSRGWYFESIPQDWSFIPLKFASDISSAYGANIPADKYVNEGVRFIRTTDISEDGALLPGGVFVSDDDIEGYLLKPGDILISRSGTVGRAFLYDSSYGLCGYAGYLIRFHLKHNYEPRFLFYLTKSAGFQEWLGTVSIEATIGNVNGEKYANFTFPCPPLQSQRRIADYLDRETARIDALVAEKEKMLALLEEKRTALISRAVTRGLDPNAPLKPSGLDWLADIPAHWRLERLKFLAEVRGGLTLGKNYKDDDLIEVPYLRVANVQDGFLDLENVTTVLVPKKDVATYLLRKGDVLMNEGGDIDKLGRGCVWGAQIDPCLHQNHVFCVRPHLVSAEWISLWTSTLEAKRYFESRAKRTTNLASISSSNIKELPVPLPPEKERREIMEFVSSMESRVKEIQSEIRRSIALLKEHRSALITAAVTGRLNLEGIAA